MVEVQNCVYFLFLLIDIFWRSDVVFDSCKDKITMKNLFCKKKYKKNNFFPITNLTNLNLRKFYQSWLNCN